MIKLNTKQKEEFEKEFEQLLNKYNVKLNPESKLAKQWASFLSGMLTKVVVVLEEEK